MVGNAGSGRDGTDLRFVGQPMTAFSLDAWFTREVLPLEGTLMAYLRRTIRSESDAADIRQETYIRIYEAAKEKPPHPVKPYLMTIARNLTIDRLRRDQIISIEAMADLEMLDIAADEPGPDRGVIARQELRRLQNALDLLPPRAREAVMLRKLEDLPRKEIAARMGITEATVAEHLSMGMHVLSEIFHGGQDLADTPNPVSKS